MANIVVFSATLTRLGFNDPTRNYLNAHGLTTIDDLLTLPVDEIEKLFKHMASQKPRDTVPGNDEAAPAPVIMVPFLSARKLKALRAWAQYRVLRAQQPQPALFINAVIDRFLDRLSELADVAKARTDDADSRPPPALAIMTKWPTWLEQFLFFLGQHRSVVGGTPLTYVVRAHDEVTQDMRDDEYDSVDEDLINTTTLTGATFNNDNRRVYDLLKPLIVEGPGWSFIQTYSRTRDGRAAFLSLKRQAEGRSAVATRKAKAYATLKNATYSGKGKFTFDQYVGIHQRGHNELLDLEEPVAETKKVADFIAGITDPKLETAKNVVDGDETKLTDFEECQQFFMTVVSNAKTRHQGASETRQVAKVHTGGKDRAKSKHKVKGSDNVPSGIAIHSGYYAPKDFNKLKPFERTEVLRLRKEQKSAGGDTREVSALTTVADEPQIATVDETPPASKKVQFGRGAHGGHRKD